MTNFEEIEFMRNAVKEAVRDKFRTDKLSNNSVQLCEDIANHISSRATSTLIHLQNQRSKDDQ